MFSCNVLFYNDYSLLSSTSWYILSKTPFIIFDTFSSEYFFDNSIASFIHTKLGVFVYNSSYTDILIIAWSVNPNLSIVQFSKYLDIFKGFSITYGSLTTLMLVMMWTYSCFYTLFLGAELNKLPSLKKEIKK